MALFVQAMLSKYNSSQYAPKKVINYSNGSLSLWKVDNKNIINYNILADWKLNMSLDISKNTDNIYVYVKKNDVDVMTPTTLWTDLKTSFDLDVIKWDNIKVNIYNQESIARTVSVNGIVWTLTRDDTPKKSLPFELKSIGNKLVAYLFGRLPNGIWRDGN